MEKIKEDAHAKINIKYIGRDKPGGKIIYSHETHNTVCDLYYDLIADRMAGGTDTLISYGHCGTSTGQGATDTNLASPCAEDRTAIDSKTQGSGGNEHKVTVIVTFGPGVCTGALTECGLFPTITYTGADMLLYDDTLDYNKPSGGTLEVTWTITHANS